MCAKAQRQERARYAPKSPTSDTSVKKSVCQSVSLSLSEAVKMQARSRQDSLGLGGFGGCRRWVVEDGRGGGRGRAHQSYSCQVGEG